MTPFSRGFGLTYGNKAWIMHGSLFGDGTVRRFLRPGQKPGKARRNRATRITTEMKGYVLLGFAVDPDAGSSGHVDVPAWELFLHDIIRENSALHPVFQRRNNDSRRTELGPFWAWNQPLLGVVGEPDDEDVATARVLKLRSLGLLGPTETL